MDANASLPLQEMSGTFLASLRSICTAVTMASVGYYLHRTKSIGTDGKRALAVLTQQVTIPLFLFTKILYCEQDGSVDACPDVTKSLPDVWMLLIWPIYVVGIGSIVGLAVAKVTKAPRHHVSTVIAACAFGNASGLPITLLNVIHSSSPSSSGLGRIDPTLFLSVFMLLYPALLWVYGGWLLDADGRISIMPTTAFQTDDNSEDIELSFDFNRHQHSSTRPFQHSANIDECVKESEHGLRNIVLNEDREYTESAKLLNEAEHCDASKVELDIFEKSNGEDRVDRDTLKIGSYRSRPLNCSCCRKVSSADEGLYLSELDLHRLDDEQQRSENELFVSETSNHVIASDEDKVQNDQSENHLLLGSEEQITKASKFDKVKTVLERCFQPPVVGAVAGIICVSFPWLRALFVDTDDRDDDAPLQFLFDGLYAVGLTAVPINMMILGCNLSSSLSLYRSRPVISETSAGLLSMRTMVGIVIGKMIVIPCIGILSGWILKSYVWDIPEDIDGAFYLVLMIVFLTPTANNVMVMIELSGSGAKEGMANVIALQYLVAPIVLSCTMTIAIGVASGWTS